MVSEANGRWGTAIEVPGLGTLNKGGDVEAGSVSCGPAGDCAAGGCYVDGNGSGRGSWSARTTATGVCRSGARPGDAEQGRERGACLGLVRLGAHPCGGRGYAGRRGNAQGFVTGQA